jgi:translation initiation factor 2D
MLPGVDLPSLPDFSHGQLLSVVVPGNPAPIAVGVAVMSSITAQGQAQGKGKLVEVLQHYGDCLWQSLANRAVPNAGFMLGLVLPVDASAAVNDAYEVEGMAAGAEVGEPDPAVALEHLSLEVQQAAAAKGGHHPADDAAAGSAEPPSSSGRSSCAWPDDMDQLMELALLQALTKSVKEEDLPLISSSLWAQHIRPCAPPGAPPLDVKKSSHKKMDKFLQVAA